jgi:ADP-heptose:LPS heptosyltransferase
LIKEILQLGGIQWQILQRGPALALRPPGVGVVPEIRNILDEARCLRALDLLISVDTLSAHLGGALGVPTWTLIPADPDWRWMENRQDTPWYPTMRLFRQAQPGQWQPVIERVVHELRRWRQGAPFPRGAMAQ